MPQPGINPITDLIKSPPAFGIPVIGNLLNVPNEIAANVVGQDIAPTPSAVADAQKNGAIASFNNRTDISPLAKMAADTGAAFLIPGYGFIGPAGDITTEATQPLVNVVSAAFKNANKLPGIGSLFDLSTAGQYNVVDDTVNSVASYLNGHGFDPSKFQQEYAGYLDGTIPDTALKADFKLSQQQLDTINSAAANVDPATIPVDPTNPNLWYTNWYQSVMKTVGQKLKYSPSQGTAAQILPGPLQGVLNKVNTVQRELKLAGGQGIFTILADQSGKSLLANRLLQITSDLPDLASGAGAQTGLIADLRDFYGPGSTAAVDLPKSAQVDPQSALEGISSSDGGVLGKATALQAAAAGGAVGLVSTGNPVDAALGALEGAMSKYGLSFSRRGMTFVDTLFRQRFLADGITGYFTDNPQVLEGVTPQFRDAGLAQVGDLAGSAAQDLFNFISQKNWLVDPETVTNTAQQLGVDPASASQIGVIWRDLNGEAQQFGEQYMAGTNLIFNRDTNLLALARNFIPFPVWPFQNAPYYAKQAIKFPGLSPTIATYLQTANQNQQQSGLTQKVNGKIPLVQTGQSTIFGNPLNFLSAASQFAPPYTQPSDTQTFLDKVYQALNQVGINVSPLVQTATQAVGLSGVGSDFPTVAHLTTPFNAAGEALTGQPTNLEGALQAPLNALRNTVAPQAAPQVTYPEYQIRQRIAELSLENTGKAWYNNPTYEAAMIDPSNPIYKQAAQQVGVNTLAFYPAKTVIPLGLTNVGNTEQTIRGTKAVVNNALQANGIQPYTKPAYQITDKIPAYGGYQYITEPEPQLVLQIKLNTYYNLSNSQSKTLYAQANPDLNGYLTWSASQKKTGGSTKLADYMKAINTNGSASTVPATVANVRSANPTTAAAAG